MSTFNYALLRELGSALYTHKQLIKRASEAKTAMLEGGLDALLQSEAFKTGKLAVKKVVDSLHRHEENEENNKPAVK